MRTALFLVVLLSIGCQGQDGSADMLQTPPSHPLSGFWKDGHCDEDFGLFIAPAGDKLYSVSFCGPGGCFEPGTYRPNTPIVGDPQYQFVSENEIGIGSANGSFQRYIRCTQAAGNQAKSDTPGTSHNDRLANATPMPVAASTSLG